MPAQNLERVTIDEYLLKLKKNTYSPALKAENKADYVLDKLHSIKIRRPNSPAPLQTDFEVLFVILDQFNQDFHYCENCHLPYSFQKTRGSSNSSYCIFCFILSQTPLPSIYANELESSYKISYLDRQVTIPTKLLDQEFNTQEDLLSFIREFNKSKTLEKSLDDYF